MISCLLVWRILLLVVAGSFQQLRAVSRRCSSSIGSSRLVAPSKPSATEILHHILAFVSFEVLTVASINMGPFAIKC